MSELLEKCSTCNALIDEEDLFCANCGTEAPHDRAESLVGATQQTTHNFDCGGCGASMSYDASAQTLQCPFCGSNKLEQAANATELAPRRVVPFAVDRDRAIGIMREWLGSSWWRPSDLADSAVITNMTNVYVPYWVFQADTFTYWTADTDQVPWGASGDWLPMTGSHRGRYNGLLIGASSALTPHETNAICPFDLAHAVPTEQVNLQNVTFEPFRVQRKYARPQARAGLEQMEIQACAQYVPGRSRNVKVNMRLENLHSEPVLLPVWMMAYRYNDRVYRYLMNGQTGKSTGTAPRSWKKPLMIVLIAIAILIGVFLIAGLASALANAQLPDSFTNPLWETCHALGSSAAQPLVWLTCG